MANPFVHIELNTTDLPKAKNFYGKLFDWKLEDMPMSDCTYTLIKVGDGTGGGMMKHPMPGQPSVWLPYVLVDDIAAQTEKARSLGATIIKDVSEVPGMGSLSIVLDPTGAVFGRGSPRKPEPVAEETGMEGGCTCRAVRYRLTSKPLFVNCCHCRWCQRESGSAFALNAMFEADRVGAPGGHAGGGDDADAQRQGQKISRCPTCRVAVWSNYSGAGDAVRFVRVGTLDEPDLLPPDIHIFTESKQPWVILSPQTPSSAQYYDREKYWPAESLARRLTMRKQR